MADATTSSIHGSTHTIARNTTSWLLVVTLVLCSWGLTTCSCSPVPVTSVRTKSWGMARRLLPTRSFNPGEPHSRKILQTRLLSIRGGQEFGDDYYDDDDGTSDDDMFDDDDAALFDMMDEADFADAAEGDFTEDNALSRTVEQWHLTPPLTKAYLTASLAATAIGYAVNKNQFPSLFLLEWYPTLMKMQLWRPFTAFLNFGPLGIGYVMTAHFVWTYMSTLERLNHDKPYDFWIMILFGCASMVAGYSILRIPPRFLGHNLSTFLVYVWSRYHEGLEVNIMELFNARAEMLPWFFLAQTFLLEGEVPVLDLLGILFGHIYHHCKTTNIIRTPRFVVDWYNSETNPYSTAIREKYKKISSDFELQ